MDQKKKLALDSDLGPFLLSFFLKKKDITTTSLFYPVHAQYCSVFMYFAKHAILRLCIKNYITVFMIYTILYGDCVHIS